MKSFTLRSDAVTHTEIYFDYLQVRWSRVYACRAVLSLYWKLVSDRPLMAMLSPETWEKLLERVADIAHFCCVDRAYSQSLLELADESANLLFTMWVVSGVLDIDVWRRLLYRRSRSLVAWPPLVRLWRRLMRQMSVHLLKAVYGQPPPPSSSSSSSSSSSPRQGRGGVGGDGGDGKDGGEDAGRLNRRGTASSSCLDEEENRDRDGERGGGGEDGDGGDSYDINRPLHSYNSHSSVSGGSSSGSEGQGGNTVSSYNTPTPPNATEASLLVSAGHTRYQSMPAGMAGPTGPTGCSPPLSSASSAVSLTDGIENVTRVVSRTFSDDESDDDEGGGEGEGGAGAGAGGGGQHGGYQGGGGG